jgi:hypothetical protein
LFDVYSSFSFYWVLYLPLMIVVPILVAALCSRRRTGRVTLATVACAVLAAYFLERTAGAILARMTGRYLVPMTALGVLYAAIAWITRRRWRGGILAALVLSVGTLLYCMIFAGEWNTIRVLGSWDELPGMLQRLARDLLSPLILVVLVPMLLRALRAARLYQNLP